MRANFSSSGATCFLRFVGVGVTIAAFISASVMPSMRVTATTATKPAGPARGGVVRVGVYTRLRTLDPHLMGTIAERDIGLALYDRLFEIDEKANLVGQLVESWERPDPTTYVLRLRKGVKFHDGTDFNAEAAKFNLDRVLNPDTRSPRRTDLAIIKDVQVVDAYTIKLGLKESSALLLRALNDRGSMMISPTALNKYGADFTRHPVGTGPFQFVEWVPGDHLTLQRFPGYWQEGVPYLDQIVFRELPDDGARAAALRAGSVDTMDNVSPKDVRVIKAAGLKITEIAGKNVDLLELNTKKPPFDNKPLRQAVGWAIDKDAILKDVYFGIGAVADSVIVPASGLHGGSLVTYYPRDLNKARQKLAEGGKPGGFEFNLMSAFPDHTRAAEVIHANLREIGVTAKIDQVDIPTLVTRAAAGDYEARMSFDGLVGDPNMHAASMYGTGGSYNVTKYSDPRVDALMKRIQSVSNPKESQRLNWELQRLIAEGAPTLPLRFGPELRAHSLRVQGYDVRLDGVRYTRVWLRQ